jgi:methylphosphotriester-DNA--protein-cysteine methyltransferase
MTPGHYTELFFLDEATALAAGHRPCAECQRDRFNLFREIWAQANPTLADSVRPAATAIDAVLHQERTAHKPASRRFCHSIADLPDGTFISDDEHHAYLILNRQLLRWSPAGYEAGLQLAVHFPARVLTPASIVRALAAGYPVGIHSSAIQA